MPGLPTRSLGPFAVSAIGLGCMNLSHAYGVPPRPEDAARLLNHALDLGITLLDTAALYGGGENERLIGHAIGHRRSEYVLASKCVLDLVDGKRVLDGSPAAIHRTLDAALRRLGTDHIDIYYLHRLDRRVPIEESVGALVEAKRSGKIGAIGLSEVSAATLRRAHAVHPIAVVQHEYSPMVRNPDLAVLPACVGLGVALVAFSPVARGLLASGVRDDRYAPGDIRATMPRFVEPQLSHNLRTVHAFEAIAREAGLTPAQLSLVWVLHRDPRIIPIPGTQNLHHLRENVAAATLTVRRDLLDAVDAIFVPGAIRGPRYGAAAQAQIDTETLPGEDLAAPA